MPALKPEAGGFTSGGWADRLTGLPDKSLGPAVKESFKEVSFCME
jgi:hypothetical protein